VIRLEEVTKKFGLKTAVERLTLEVAPGEVCALVGPSGCGKTTTLRMVNRLIEPDSGRIIVNGLDARSIQPDKLRRTIGYVIQGTGLFPHLTVEANIGIVPGLLGWERSRTRQRSSELLELVGLPAEYARKYPSELSGGEAQRIGVARALAADPPILLMDEPFGAVDPRTREMLQGEFQRIQQTLQKTVIIVTHDLDEAIRLGDRLAVMKGGRLEQHDKPETVLAHPSNKFVHDFVGSDRALKRLSRVPVQAYVRPASSVRLDNSLADAAAACRQCRWVWVTDPSGRLLGWVDQESLPLAGSLLDLLVAGDARDIGILKNASLREALSRMLGQGLRSLPVVDSGGRLEGEVSLDDVEKSLTESAA
jgi:osmoprotectant transport system ATP-binding protein